MLWRTRQCSQLDSALAITDDGHITIGILLTHRSSGTAADSRRYCACRFHTSSTPVRAAPSRTVRGTRIYTRRRTSSFPACRRSSTRARGRGVTVSSRVRERARHGTYGIFKLRVHLGNYRTHGFKLREHVFGRIHLTTHKCRHLDAWNNVNEEGIAPRHENYKKTFNIPDLSLVRYARSELIASPAPFRGRSEKRETAVCVQLELCRTQLQSIPWI